MLIIIPKWLPEFIKKWIFKDGQDGDAYIRNGETLTLGRDMRYRKVFIEDGGILNTDHFRIYVSKLLFLERKIEGKVITGMGGKT
jgi:hypothetical protein